MCLYVGTNNFRGVAHTTGYFLAYKSLMMRGVRFKGNTLSYTTPVTPCQKAPIPANGVLTARGRTDIGKSVFDPSYAVNGGFIHFYTRRVWTLDTVVTAKHFKKHINAYHAALDYLDECTLPELKHQIAYENLMVDFPCIVKAEGVIFVGQYNAAATEIEIILPEYD